MTSCVTKKKATSQISFPLGGIGSGCVGLSGNGHWIDWEIYNHPGKRKFNGCSHLAVRAGKDGKVVDFRLLHGDEPPPYQGITPAGDESRYSGFGWGPSGELLCGWPHFRNHIFEGEFPLAKIEFDDPHFPGKVALHAWSPFIPGNSRDSSLPAACFDVEIVNDTADVLDYSCIGVLCNPWSGTEHVNAYSEHRLTVRSGLPEEDLRHGDLTFEIQEGAAEFSGQSYWFRGGWVDSMETYHSDVMRGGYFIQRDYADELSRTDHGLLAAHFKLNPGEHRKVSFVLTWNVPLRRNDWRTDADELAKKNGIANLWRNYYATQWKDSCHTARYVAENRKRLEADTRKFHDALFAGNLPKEMIEGISANLAVLRSPTCLRLEDGTFYGWEGVGSFWGSCEGSCTHVWNYAQALAFLFPDLERSMRESHLHYSVDQYGGAHFRLNLPLGIRATPDMFRPCADGQFGDIMKFYRDWKLCGDNAWLRHWYPTLKKMVEYAWSTQNYDRWDPDQSGVLQGRQHHTLDMELFGPNSWLTGHYLGALSAIAEMADEMEDSGFAALCRAIRERGKNSVEKNLFNGEYYHQKIDLENQELLSLFQAENYWNTEDGEIRYQIADGCGIDSTLAQCYASLYGLPQIFDPERDQTTLRSIFQYNYRPTFRDVFNPWRIYALNDESGVQICTWPHGKRPAIPIPYHTETMHGFEWTFAVHLIQSGMPREAITVVRSIRSRYDGIRRNPWNELECGSNYARSLASYALLPAWSGFRFDLSCGMIGFEPPGGTKKLCCFWSIGSAWGIYEQEKRSAKIRILHGKLHLKNYRTPRSVRELRTSKQKIGFSQEKDMIRLNSEVLLAAGSELHLKFK